MIQNDDSETDEEIFWNSPTEPEEITETDMPETNKYDKKGKSQSELMWDNRHINKTIKTIPKLNKDNKKMMKLRRDFLTKFILFSIVIGRCATAKEIGGLTIENKIQKGNLPDRYFVEQSNKEIIIEKID